MRPALPLLLPLLFLCACGDTTHEPSPGDAGSDGGITPDGGEDGGPDEDAGPSGGPGVVGLLIDQVEQPLGRTRVMACMSFVCLFGETDADGRFRFDIESPVGGAIKTHEELEAWPRQAAALEPFVLADDSLVDVGSVLVPDLPDGAPIGPETEDPQTLTAGDGLELTFRRADLTPPFGVTLSDLAACHIPSEHVPVYPELASEEVVAVYALHPFGTLSASPIGVRLPSALPAGTAVRFRTMSDLDGSFSSPVAGEADGAFLATDPGSGVDRWTYLVVSRP